MDEKEEELILVTGASGFLASHIIKQLLEKGRRVRGTVRNLTDNKKVDAIKKYCENPKYPIDLVQADLTDENFWLNAVKDCTYVIHTASPVPNYVPNDENEIIVPAVNGVQNVFKACVQSGMRVKRVVLTSSVAAIAGDAYETNKTYTELDYSEAKKSQPYTKSKILAEKAAWDFVNERKTKNENCFDLVVINPGYISGPILSSTFCASIEVVKRLILNELPMVPDIVLPGCDVRDVALLHILVLESKEAVSNRYMIVNKLDGETFIECAHWIKEEFGNKGYSIPTRQAPNFLIKFFGLFDKTVSFVVPMVGKRPKFDSSKIKNQFNIIQIDRKKSIIDMAYSLIEHKFVPKRF